MMVATIEHLRADMPEARTAYEDLSRSTMELMGKAQQDGGQWMSDKAEMRATLRIATPKLLRFEIP